MREQRELRRFCGIEAPKARVGTRSTALSGLRPRYRTTAGTSLAAVQIGHRQRRERTDPADLISVSLVRPPLEGLPFRNARQGRAPSLRGLCPRYPGAYSGSDSSSQVGLPKAMGRELALAGVSRRHDSSLQPLYP